jgi:hypothetical protein
MSDAGSPVDDVPSTDECFESTGRGSNASLLADDRRSMVDGFWFDELGCLRCDELDSLGRMAPTPTTRRRNAVRVSPGDEPGRVLREKQALESKEPQERQRHATRPQGAVRIKPSRV